MKQEAMNAELSSQDFDSINIIKKLEATVMTALKLLLNADSVNFVRVRVGLICLLNLSCTLQAISTKY
jgi:hypothetical protein